MTKLDPVRVRELVRGALREDRVDRDRTVAYLEMSDSAVSARILCRGRGVVAGTDVARIVFEECDPGVRLDVVIVDGSPVCSGDVVADLHGPAPAILGGERVALNFMQRLSGIATLTAKFVSRANGVTILDTRKTTPLHRALEKYAVTAGGGENHRFDLADMILIKENHIRAMGGTSALSDVIRHRKADGVVEVEVDSLELLRSLFGAPIDRIMLDNFSPEAVRRAVREVVAYRESDPSFAPALEVSGGVDLTNVDQYAIEGVDYISVGALTHSAPALDFSLEVAGG